MRGVLVGDDVAVPVPRSADERTENAGEASRSQVVRDVIHGFVPRDLHRAAARKSAHLPALGSRSTSDASEYRLSASRFGDTPSPAASGMASWPPGASSH